MSGTWHIDPAVLAALRLDQVEQALEQGRAAQALLEVEELLDASPDDTRAIFYAGQAALALGDAGTARLALAHCDRLRPHDPAILSPLAAACFESADLAAARQLAEQALALAPRDPGAWFTLALVLERTGAPDAAADAFQQAHTLAPERFALPRAPLSDARWQAVLDEVLSATPPAVQAFYLQVPLRWEDYPDPEELLAAAPPISPLCGALYVGTPPEEADPWQQLPEAVRLFRGNLKHAVPLGTSLQERLSLALIDEVLSWTGAAREDILPD